MTRPEHYREAEGLLGPDDNPITVSRARRRPSWRLSLTPISRFRRHRSTRHQHRNMEWADVAGTKLVDYERCKLVDLLLTIWRHRGRNRSLAQVSGSYRVVWRLIPAGAVAAFWCCTTSSAVELAITRLWVRPVYRIVPLTLAPSDPPVGLYASWSHAGCDQIWWSGPARCSFA
jgi:hypothetical protein